MRFKCIFLRRLIYVFLIIFFISLYCFWINYLSNNSEKFYKSYSKSWSDNIEFFFSQEFPLSKTKCYGNFNQYYNKFVVLRNVFIDKSKFIGLKGGESLQTVLNQSEKLEYFQYKPGFLSIPCSDILKEKILFPLGNINHLNKYYQSLTYYSIDLLDFIPSHVIYEKKVLFVTRNEYANFYHTVTDFYVIFLICRILKWPVHEVHVILTDAHPWSLLDEVWKDLFPNLSRLSDFTLENKFIIKEMAWVPFGYIAPIMQFDWPTSPLMNEFRDFVLSTYNITTEKRIVEKCNLISILFIWRRNYLAHPRNPSGEISRKINNEMELFSAIKAASKNDRFLSKFQIDVSEKQLEKYSMKNQLEIISKTSIIIAMHGASLTHTLFLPAGAGLLELFPLYYDEKNAHFKSICKWRRLHYEFFVNKSPKMEMGKFSTYFKPDVVIERVKNIIKKFQCNI